MIEDFIIKFWNWICSFFEQLHAMAGWIADTIVYNFLNVPFVMFKLFLDTVHKLLSVLSCGSMDCGSFNVNISTGWSLLWSQLLYLMGQIGLDVGLAMLAFAYCMRFLLNLIPGAYTRV